MAEFKKKDKNSFWYSPLSIFILLVLLIFSTYRVVGLIKKERETAEKKELTLDKIDELKEREKILNNEINKMLTDEGVEEVIREKYQVVKQDEKMVIIVDKEEEVSLQVEAKTDHSFMGWIRGLFEK